MYSEAKRSFLRRGFSAFLLIACALQTAVHGTWIQAGADAQSFSFMVEGLNATVRINATAPAKCERPEGWCDADGGKYYKERDCNMDGAMDRICDTHNTKFTGGEKRWILLSGSCSQYNTGDAPACAELQPKEDALNRWDASSAAAWQDVSDHAKRGTIASKVVIESGMHKVVKIRVSDCPGSAPIQVGISTAGWQPNAAFGKESSRSVWGTTALAILAYSGHQSLSKEDVIHERHDKWNGPQMVTLDVDMSLNPHTIEWRSDKHDKDFSKAFFTWEKVSPSVHNALSTCKYTLLSVEDPSIVTWINAPAGRAPQGADDKFMKRASFKKATSDTEGGCLPYCAQDPDVFAVGVKSSKPDGEYCWCFTRYLSNAIYEKAVKKYDDANVVIAKWVYPESNYQAYTKILRTPVPGYPEPKQLEAASGCPEDGSSCDNWFSLGCSSQKPGACSNEHAMSPYAVTLPKDERPESRWYVKGCAKGKCQDLWMIFDLKEDFLILSKLNLLNYQDVYGVKKLSFLTSSSLTGPWKPVQAFDDIPVEGEGNAGITQNYCCEIPNTDLIFENPVVGRYLRLQVDENHGGEGAGLHRAYFHGYKGCDDIKERGKSCKGAVHVKGSPGMKDVYTCWAAVREQCDGDTRFDFDATRGACRCTHTNCKDTVQDSTSHIYEVCEACPAISARDRSCREKAYVSGSPGIRDAQACLDKVRKECPESRYFSFRASDDTCMCGGGEEPTCTEWEENAGFNVYAVCGAAHGVPSKVEWKLLLRQTFPELFEEDVWSKNENDPKNDNFAVLDQLESFRIDGAFTFKLRWPNKFKDQVWRQRSNPVTSEGKVEGYEAVETPYEGNGWGGLRRGQGKSLLDGSANMDPSYWYYAVGATREWRGGFPGPDGPVQQVELWVRAPTDEVCWAPLKSKGYLITEIALERNIFRVNVECDKEKEYEGTARAVACEGGKDNRYKLRGCYEKGEERSEGCHASCATCTGPAQNQCASCTGKRFLAVTTCVFECPAGLFSIEDPENGNKCVDSTTTPVPKEEELDWIVKHNINWTIYQGQTCSVDLALGSDRSGTSSDACTKLCGLDSRCEAVSTILRGSKITRCRLFSSCEDLQQEDDANTYAKATTTTTTVVRFKWIEIGPGKCTDSSGRNIKAALPSKAIAQKRAPVTTTTTTAAPEWEYLTNRGGTDLVAILKGPRTSSGKTELSILSASSYYMEELAHYSTPLPYTHSSFWQFGMKSNGDLVAIQTGPRTKSKKTEVYVLSRASRYQKISLKAATPVGYTRPINNRFLVKWNGDLVGVWKGPNTGSGRTEVHVLSAASRYRRWVLHMASPLHYCNDDRWQFGMRANGDVVGVLHKGPTGSKMTEVHIMSAATNYRTWALETGTAYSYAPSGVQFVVAHSGDLLAVREGPGIGLGSGRPEAVHTLTLKSAYKDFAIGTPKFGALASSACVTGGCDPPQTPDLAFDGNPRTFWNGCCKGYPNQWLEYKFDAPTLIKGYGLTTSDGECPVAWTFEGSFDGENFHQLDKQQGQGCLAWEEQVYNLREASLQRVFRWKFTEGVGGNSNGFILREVRFFTTEKEEEGAKDCYAERTLVADEGRGVGNRRQAKSVAACYEECSSIGNCQSFSYCPDGSNHNCHYKEKIVGAHDAATTDAKKLKDCKTFYKTECKDKGPETSEANEPRVCYKARTLVADEGEELGNLPGDNSLQKCEEQCSSLLGCNSFAMCDKPSSCWFKKKIVGTADRAAKHENAKKCKTYYKVDCPEEVKECYAKRPLVADEGKPLGDTIGTTLEKCEKKCSSISGCNSFAMCSGKNCHYKDKVINETDKSTTNKKKLADCNSYYKADCDSQAGEKIIRFDKSGCKRDDKQFAYWKDKCYSFEACADHCETSSGCYMFQTNGCHCIFYGAVSSPYTAPEIWKCGIKTKVWQPVCTPFASDAVGDAGWGEACKAVPKGAAYLKLDMGDVVDYFRPQYMKPYCEMLVSNNKHEFSPDGERWYTPQYYHTHLGGSRHLWPARELKDRGDKRRYLSFWGSTHSYGLRGCCHDAYDDTPSWNREFSFYYCAPKCVDDLDGEDYCSKWCNHKGKWGCGVQSHGAYSCDCTGCSGCQSTTTTTTQGVLLGFSGPYRINGGGDVDGFTYFRSVAASDNFLTPEKVGDKCDAWAVVGGLNGRTHAGGIRYYWTHIGSPQQAVHFEFHFCDFVSIKRLRVGSPNSNHDILRGTLQYWHKRQWVTAATGHQINQRNWLTEWQYPVKAWEVLYTGGVSSQRWRLANYNTKNHKYFSGIELSWVPKGREYERLQTSCANAKQHLSGRILVDSVEDCEELCNARPGCDSFVHAEEEKQHVCYLKQGCRGLPGPCKNWCGYQLKGAEGSERKCLTFKNWRKASEGPQVQISLGSHMYGADVGAWQSCLLLCQLEPKCKQVVYKDGNCFGTSAKKDEDADKKGGKNEGYMSAHCFEEAKFRKYRLNVGSNGGATIWCLEELKLFGSDGARLQTLPKGGSAQSTHAGNFGADKAFNEISHNDDSYYCSAPDRPTGWLQYTFDKPMALGSYRLERRNDGRNDVSPVSWTFAGSNDGRDWTILDTQSGHSFWNAGEEKSFSVDPDSARNTASTWTVFYRGRLASPPGHFESSAEKGDSTKGHFFKRLPMATSEKTLLRVTVEGGPCGERTTVQFPIGNKQLLDFLREGKQSKWVPVDNTKVQVIEGSVKGFCNGRIDHFWTGEGENKGWILGCRKSCSNGREFASGHYGGCGKSCNGQGNFKDLSETEVTMSFGQEPAEFCGWAEFPSRAPAHADCRHVMEHPSKEFVGGCTTAECQSLNDCNAKCSECSSCVAVSYFEDGAQGFRCHMIGPQLQRLEIVEKIPDPTTWALHVSTRSENCKISVQVEGKFETCLAIKMRYPDVNSGVFVLRTPDADEFETWCDMSMQGGGWTLLAASKQSGGHVANLFRRGTYKSYTETGIGNPDLDASGMFWAPLKIWAQYTEEYPRNRMVALDSHFQNPANAPGLNDMGINAKDGYRIRGNAVNSGPLNEVAQRFPQKFTTFDNDQDSWGANCAKDYRGYNGGFWYRHCMQTGMYHSDGKLYSWNHNKHTAVSWIRIFFREDSSLQTTTTTTMYVTTTTTTTTTTLGYVVEDLGQCQEECDEGEDCMAISFNERTKECHMFGDIEMGYGNYIDEDDVMCYAKAPQGWFEYRLRPSKLWDERCSSGETKCDFEETENFKGVCQEWCSEENATRFCSVDISGRKNPCCKRSTTCEDLESAGREYRIFKHQDHYVGMQCEDGSKCLLLSWKFNVAGQFPKDVATESCRAGCDSTDCHAFTLRSNYDNPEDDSQLSCFLYKEYAPKNTRCSFDPLNRHDCAVRTDSGQIWVNLPVQREYNVIGSGQTFQRVVPEAEEMASVRVYGNATMSSTYSPETDAQKCNDRKSDTRCISKWTEGRGENSPWWQMDIGKEERIVKIRILSEPDSCRLQKYVNMTCSLKGGVVGVSSRPCAGDQCSGYQCGTLSEPGSDGYHEVSCGIAPDYPEGRYVYVQLQGNRNLHMWEFIAYKVSMSVPAKGTPSTSSVYEGAIADYCSDDDETTRCSTAWNSGRGEQDPRYQVDLHSAESIDKIQFFAKPDGCEAMPSHGGVHCNPFGATFGVSLTPCQDGVCDGHICGNLTKQSYKEDWFEISCGGMAGRYVFVQLPGKRVLNFYELKPFKDITAVSITGQASMSSTFGNFFPRYCVDGKAETRCSSKWNGAHGELNPWFQLDLGALTPIKRIQILKSDSCVAMRGLSGMHCNHAGAVLGVSDEPCEGTSCHGKVCGKPFKYSDQGNWYGADCGGMQGRYVYVQLPGNRVLNFYEMLVFESKDPYAKYKKEVEVFPWNHLDEEALERKNFRNPWKLVLKQDIRGGMRRNKYAWTFQVHNYDKVMHYVAPDKEKHFKYSILSEVGDYKLESGKFKFRLEYLSSTGTAFGIWEQETNPFDPNSPCADVEKEESDYDRKKLIKGFSKDCPECQIPEEWADFVGLFRMCNAKRKGYCRGFSKCPFGVAAGGGASQKESDSSTSYLKYGVGITGADTMRMHTEGMPFAMETKLLVWYEKYADYWKSREKARKDADQLKSLMVAQQCNGTRLRCRGEGDKPCELAGGDCVNVFHGCEGGFKQCQVVEVNKRESVCKDGAPCYPTCVGRLLDGDRCEDHEPLDCQGGYVIQWTGRSKDSAGSAIGKRCMINPIDPRKCTEKKDDLGCVAILSEDEEETYFK